MYSCSQCSPDTAYGPIAVCHGQLILSKRCTGVALCCGSPRPKFLQPAYVKSLQRNQRRHRSPARRRRLQLLHKPQNDSREGKTTGGTAAAPAISTGTRVSRLAIPQDCA